MFWYISCSYMSDEEFLVGNGVDDEYEWDCTNRGVHNPDFCD